MNEDKQIKPSESEKDKFLHFEQETRFIEAFESANPQIIIAHKMEAEHITALFSNEDNEGKREFAKSRDNKIWTFGVVCLVLAFVLIFCLIFKNDPEMIKTIVIPLITLILGAVSGGAAGYGIGIRKGNSDN
jgi:uncharacterized integral membrane protein